jgi:hypothetical protein
MTLALQHDRERLSAPRADFPQQREDRFRHVVPVVVEQAALTARRSNRMQGNPASSRAGSKPKLRPRLQSLCQVGDSQVAVR